MWSADVKQPDVRVDESGGISDGSAETLVSPVTFEGALRSIGPFSLLNTIHVGQFGTSSGRGEEAYYKNRMQPERPDRPFQVLLRSAGYQ
ncbi:uncharacterized protein N7487_001950 [Penicillium crustosum]|uniref:uncharacterized protein n=1 Tax=Penicillium crustosum TaxID=36656 RepID=UPI00238D2689|nr:uncharacterized protein N7487_001950 [Penicillium crustosum]KAJ5418400.1 hypothetical protein N7487_001950 [Penicillium crustosum]